MISILILGFTSVSHAQRATIEGVPTDTILSESQRIEQKNNLRSRIFREHIPTKNDYVDRYDRGTVEYNDDKGINILGNVVHKRANYSFHKTVIPDGSTITEVNFTQRRPETEAIVGKNLHFVNCILLNVKLDPTWTYHQGIRFQQSISRETVDGTQYRVYKHKVLGDDTFREVLREEITP